MKELKISETTVLTTAITANRDVKNLEWLKSITAKAVIRILTSVMTVLLLVIFDFFNSLTALFWQQ